MLIFSAGVMAGGWRMPPSNTFGPGAGFLPVCLGAAMAILSLMLFINATREPRQEKDRSPFPDWKTCGLVLITIAGLGAYNLLIEPLGFLASTTLFSAFLLGVIERVRWPVSVAAAIANSIVLYVIFQVLLGIALPKNVLGF